MLVEQGRESAIGGGKAAMTRQTWPFPGFWYTESSLDYFLLLRSCQLLEADA